MTTLRDAPDAKAGRGGLSGPTAPGGPAAAAARPFTPVEELDLYLENAREPNLVQLETHTRGHLDPSALAAALADVLAADPAARRRLAVTSRWARRLRWETTAPGAPADGRHAPGGPAPGDPAPGGPIPSGPAPRGEAGLLTVARWGSPGELAALRERLSGWPMSLTETTARVILAIGPEHDVVLLHTHHAAFDGISSLALLAAIGAAYRGHAEADPDPADPDPADPDPADPDTGANSGPNAGPNAGPEPASPSRPGLVPAKRQRRAPLPGLVTRIAGRAGGPGRPGYGAALRSIAVPRIARQGGGPFPTVNDLLVAALILTVDRWNAARGRRSGIIKITVPVNARDPRRRWEGPGNQSRLIRVTAGPDQRADLAGLLAHVAGQTWVGKSQARPGLDAVSRLLAAAWAPAPVKRRTARLVRRLARPVCTDTSLVSNLGVIPEPPCFGGEPEPLWFSGPAPMPRGLAVGAVTVAGRLHLSVHYRPALLDEVAAADFTAAYCDALTELSGQADLANGTGLPQGRPP